jgi:biopolymer transport protein ExbB/TolQ
MKVSPSSAKPLPRLSFVKDDIERRVLCPAGRFTSAGPVLPLVMALLATVAFYVCLIPIHETWFGRSFTHRGWVPYATVSFSFWALSIAIVKWRKIAFQERALDRPVVPLDPGFVISATTVQQVLDNLYQVVDDPRDFILFNRIQVALSNLRNMGQIGDVDNILRSQSDSDEAAMESSYTVVRSLIWAIPVWGFIGTALGLSQAISAFTSVLQGAKDIEAIKSSLNNVTSGLAVSFETTLQALLAALFIQLFLTMLKRREEQMNDEFMDYCQRQIVGRLRIYSPEFPGPYAAYAVPAVAPAPHTPEASPVPAQAPANPAPTPAALSTSEAVHGKAP